MTLNEAIIHYEKLAKENEEDANMLKSLDHYEKSKSLKNSCKKYEENMAEYKQLVTWLKELKNLKE